MLDGEDDPSKGLERGSRAISLIPHLAHHLTRRGRPENLIYSYLLVYILARSQLGHIARTAMSDNELHGVGGYHLSNDERRTRSTDFCEPRSAYWYLVF